MKRTVRLLITVALCVVILAQLTYLSRGLFEQWICRGIESTLSEMTGSIVKVGSLRGNWVDHVVIDEVELVGSPESLLQEVEGLRLELAFSPLDLLFDNSRKQLSDHVRNLALQADGPIRVYPYVFLWDGAPTAEKLSSEPVRIEQPIR